MSHRTILTSSMIIISTLFTTLISSSLSAYNFLFFMPGMYGPRGRCRKECMVTPSAFFAATPVGARTTTFFFLRLHWEVSSRSTVVLPVPALPVMKSDSPSNTKFNAFFPYLSNSIFKRRFQVIYCIHFTG